MSLQHALLGVLEARPMSGYDLVQFFDSSTAWIWAAPQSQIYPTLRRMERAGLITGDDEPRGPKLTRTVYSVTDQGREELERWLSTPHDPSPPRDPFLVQALNFDTIDAEKAHAVLEQFITEQEKAAAEAEAHRQRLLNKDTMLLKERLTRRDPAEHDRIARLKAHVFAGVAAVARTRAEWAREGQRLLTED
ncbi:PadR family transcriptional regulator [Kibdelosporangium aridum]|uniref:DNA-binding transcriptional regulator, PadR family n=1 Tax=Kibdelosporangium aridum TaxID=2030 RepID=A0A1Y5XVK4_KIBAR|nr:PadR family transcriptional regulator [Kibdelosporangium aridum]SMD19310.1 DNA-binding transcriptional regulator, PadR family [Kibdelosporangium aridum]